MHRLPHMACHQSSSSSTPSRTSRSAWSNEDCRLGGGKPWATSLMSTVCETRCFREALTQRVHLRATGWLAVAIQCLADPTSMMAAGKFISTQRSALRTSRKVRNIRRVRSIGRHVQAGCQQSSEFDSVRSFSDPTGTGRFPNRCYRPSSWSMLSGIFLLQQKPLRLRTMLKIAMSTSIT